MKDKITIATYMRVGNKEQLDTTGQEHKIPTPEELKAEGYDVVTLPKKKAWLFMRSSVGMPDSERDTRMGNKVYLLFAYASIFDLLAAISQNRKPVTTRRAFCFGRDDG